jgi:lysozyme family protein
MSEFLTAIPYVLKNEGGYVNNPKDPGGETKYGICKRDHPLVDIKNLTPEQADEIYRTQYWSCGGIASQPVATKFLDMAVNMEGTGRAGAAVKILQQAVAVQFPNVLRPDGHYGPNTELMVNRCDATRLLADMARLACARYNSLADHNPDFETFRDGWLVRAEKLPNAQGACA